MKTFDVAEKASYSKTTSRSPRIFARAKDKGSLKNNTISFKASCILLTDALLSNGHKVRELCLKLNVFYSLVQMCLQIIDGTVLKVPRVSLTDTVSKKLFSDGTVLKALRVLLTDADIFASHTLTTGMCLKRHAFLLTHTDSS